MSDEIEQLKYQLSEEKKARLEAQRQALELMMILNQTRHAQVVAEINSTQWLTPPVPSTPSS